MKAPYIAVALLASTIWASAHGSVQTASGTPSLAAVLQAYGKPTSSPEFRVLVEAFCLKRYFRKEQVHYSLASTRAPASFPVWTYERYGGSGLVVVTTSTRRTPADLDTVAPDETPTIRGLWLILGDCTEKEYFGLWKGELPEVELPQTPDALLARYPSPEADITEIEYPLPARRRIRYNSQLPNRMPYVFTFSNGRLAYLEIFPERPPPMIVPPQPP